MLEVAVDERHRRGAVTHGSAHALGRAATHVAGREQAGDAGLEGKGVALEWPARRTPAAVEQVGAGEQVAARVEA